MEDELDFSPLVMLDHSKALAFCYLLLLPVAGLHQSQCSREFSLSVGAPRKHKEDEKNTLTLAYVKLQTGNILCAWDLEMQSVFKKEYETH